MSGPLTTPEGVAFFRLLQLRGALSLELKGLRHSSGGSAYATAKREYGLRGSRTSVLAQLQAMVEVAIQRRLLAGETVDRDE